MCAKEIFPRRPGHPAGHHLAWRSGEREAKSIGRNVGDNHMSSGDSRVVVDLYNRLSIPLKAKEGQQCWPEVAESMNVSSAIAMDQADNIRVHANAQHQQESV